MTENEIIKLLKPETEIERFILTFPEVLKGLDWGIPRFGHPEGKVVYHIVEIFKNLENIRPVLSLQDYQTLRIIALLHDTFKFRENRNIPRDWTQHHSVLAADFAEKIISDKIIIDIIRNHDEAYYCWALFVFDLNPYDAQKRLAWLLDEIGYCLQLYYIFFTCDTATGDKNQIPVRWFEENVSGLEPIFFKEQQTTNNQY